MLLFTCKNRRLNKCFILLYSYSIGMDNMLKFVVKVKARAVHAKVLTI